MTERVHLWADRVDPLEQHLGELARGHLAAPHHAGSLARRQEQDLAHAV
jgi:hypothetical protein